MKQTKKFMSLLLALVMVLSLTNGLTVKAAEAAADTITVTLRVEQDEATMVPPTKVVLTEDDLKDYGIGLSEETLTPLHALAKYMEGIGATEETMSQYINQSKGWISGISVKGDITKENPFAGGPSVTNMASTSWMTAFNDCSGLTIPGAEPVGEGEDSYIPSYTSYDYPLKDEDSITFYGICYAAKCYYTVFDKAVYESETNKALEINLKGVNGFTADTPADAPVSDANILVGKISEDTNSVTKDNAIDSYQIKTDEKGTANVTFTEAGTYVLSAYRTVTATDYYTQQELTFSDISRPYAIVTVTEPKKEEQNNNPNTSNPNTSNPNNNDPNGSNPGSSNSNNNNPNSNNTNVGNTNTDNTNATNTNLNNGNNDTTSDGSNNTVDTKVTKPSKVTSVKASVAKKIKNKKKSVTLSWKKLSKVTGYQIYLSKKKSSGYKKTATVKAAKKTLKLKKGTYYVKVRAYNKKDSTTIYGAFSKVVKVSVKK